MRRVFLFVHWLLFVVCALVAGACILSSGSMENPLLRYGGLWAYLYVLVTILFFRRL